VFHPIDFCRVDQTTHMGIKSKTSGTKRRVITTGTLEDAATVVDDMRSNMDVSVIPVYETAIHPNFSGT